MRSARRSLKRRRRPTHIGADTAPTLGRKMPTITASNLRKLAIDVFKAVDAPEDHATVVADHLVEANLVGMDSHGMIRVPQYVRIIREGKLKPAAQYEIVRETSTMAVIHGHSVFGQVAATAAMNLSIDKARAHSLAVVALSNCAHTGRLGHYTTMAANANMIGMMVVNAGGAGQWVAPFGGTDRRLATNPISIGVPTGGPDPLLMDMASSVSAEGKVRSILHKGGMLPPGWIQNYLGQPTTDPKDLYEPELGSILPIGGNVGYKGFALSVMIDVLAGALSGAGCVRDDAPSPTGYSEDGALMIAIDIESMTPLDEFIESIKLQREHIKASPPGEGFSEVFMPGELEARAKADRTANGVPVADETWRQIAEVTDSLGLVSGKYL